MRQAVFFWIGEQTELLTDYKITTNVEGLDLSVTLGMLHTMSENELMLSRVGLAVEKKIWDRTTTH